MSILHVAKKAGVSTATVSRVINGDHKVSAHYRNLVESAMAKLGYVPRPPSRRPGPRAPARLGIHKHHVALLMMGIKKAATNGNVFGDLLHGVEEALATNDIDLTIAEVDENGRLPMNVERGQLDGLLLFGKMPNPKLGKKLKLYPCVWLLGIFNPIFREWGAHVTCNNVEIGRIAADYLIRRGHKELAFIQPFGGHPDIPARGIAFRDAAAHAGVHAVSISGKRTGLSFPPNEMLERLLEPLINDLVQLRPRPTGIFCPSDHLAALTYRLLQLRKVRPGFDMEIVACNNEQSYLAGLLPRPATIDICAEAIGREGVQQLLGKLRHPEQPLGETIQLSPKLVEGDPEKIRASLQN